MDINTKPLYTVCIVEFCQGNGVRKRCARVECDGDVGCRRVFRETSRLEELGLVNKRGLRYLSGRGTEGEGGQW